MERHSLRALLSIGLLVVAAWIGIALVGKLHGTGGWTIFIVVWGVAMAALLWFALRSVFHARRARVERRSEETNGR